MGLEGLFQIAYATSEDVRTPAEKIIVLARGGELFGADRFGGVYRGMMAPETAHSTGIQPLSLTYDVPPGGELVTGFVAGDAGASIEIRVDIDPSRRSQTAGALVSGFPVEIEVTWLGPLPR